MSSQLLDQLRLIGAAGSNRAMEAELKRLAARGWGKRLPKPERTTPQTLCYPFDTELAWVALRYARTPSRIVWDIARISARRLEPLFDQAVQLLVRANPLWLVNELRFSVEVRNADAFAAGPLQIRGAVKNAVEEAAKTLRRSGVSVVGRDEAPTILLRAEATEDTVLLSVDLGGRSLHRRGERTLVGEASLKETLAAQVLLLSRWDSRSEALVDAMAGAGTFALEAAGSAVGRATWSDRPSIGSVPPFSSLDEETPDLFPGKLPPIASIEVHTPSHRALQTNLERAGLEALPALHADFRDVPRDYLARVWGRQDDFPSAGLVVVNPPYGERLEKGRGRDPELEALYTDLFDWWNREFPMGWRIALLGPGRALKEVFGGQPKLDKPMKNGPLSVSLLVYERGK